MDLIELSKSATVAGHSELADWLVRANEKKSLSLELMATINKLELALAGKLDPEFASYIIASTPILKLTTGKKKTGGTRTVSYSVEAGKFNKELSKVITRNHDAMITHCESRDTFWYNFTDNENGLTVSIKINSLQLAKKQDKALHVVEEVSEVEL